MVWLIKEILSQDNNHGVYVAEVECEEPYRITCTLTREKPSSHRYHVGERVHIVGEVSIQECVNSLGEKYYINEQHVSE